MLLRKLRQNTNFTTHTNKNIYLFLGELFALKRFVSLTKKYAKHPSQCGMFKRTVYIIPSCLWSPQEHINKLQKKVAAIDIQTACSSSLTKLLVA